MRSVLTIFLNCSTLKSLIPWEQPTWIWSLDRRQVLWWASKMESDSSWPILSGSANTDGECTDVTGLSSGACLL